ncbi:ABC transporter permease [Pseudonocardia spinosispora]|uniref:ABC transporter permease n=1 Tax=Pseudonocardia spinosispora TaxID=103441 RepID=UPI00040C4FF5|nr:ABC transporter permease [Pseudonocardia spinosispora]
MTVTSGDSKLATLRKVYGGPLAALDEIGKQSKFYGSGLLWTYRAVGRYKKEEVRLIAEVGMGNGALALIGGSAIISGFILFFTGTTGGTQVYQALRQVNLEALAGFTGATIQTRLSTPIVMGATLCATVGTGFTAQLGAMRISEEIDALEVMGIRSMPYLVATRIIAGLIVIVPLYCTALVFGWMGWKFSQVNGFGLSEGTYDHYFDTFLQPIDIVYSVLQGVAQVIVVVLIHTYYGYNATGGPVGVGQAVGRAVRLSLIAVMTVGLAVAMAVYGGSDTFRISG